MRSCGRGAPTSPSEQGWRPTSVLSRAIHLPCWQADHQPLSYPSLTVSWWDFLGGFGGQPRSPRRLAPRRLPSPLPITEVISGGTTIPLIMRGRSSRHGGGLLAPDQWNLLNISSWPSTDHTRRDKVLVRIVESAARVAAARGETRRSRSTHHLSRHVARAASTCLAVVGTPVPWSDAGRPDEDARREACSAAGAAWSFGWALRLPAVQRCFAVGPLHGCAASSRHLCAPQGQETTISQDRARPHPSTPSNDMEGRLKTLSMGQCLHARVTAAISFPGRQCGIDLPATDCVLASYAARRTSHGVDCKGGLQRGNASFRRVTSGPVGVNGGMRHACCTCEVGARSTRSRPAGRAARLQEEGLLGPALLEKSREAERHTDAVITAGGTTSASYCAFPHRHPRARRGRADHLSTQPVTERRGPSPHVDPPCRCSEGVPQRREAPASSAPMAPCPLCGSGVKSLAGRGSSRRGNGGNPAADAHQLSGAGAVPLAGAVGPKRGAPTSSTAGATAAAAAEVPLTPPPEGVQAEPAAAGAPPLSFATTPRGPALHAGGTQRFDDVDSVLCTDLVMGTDGAYHAVPSASRAAVSVLATPTVTAVLPLQPLTATGGGEGAVAPVPTPTCVCGSMGTAPLLASSPLPLPLPSSLPYVSLSSLPLPLSPSLPPPTEVMQLPRPPPPPDSLSLPCSPPPTMQDGAPTGACAAPLLPPRGNGRPSPSRSPSPVWPFGLAPVEWPFGLPYVEWPED